MANELQVTSSKSPHTFSMPMSGTRHCALTSVFVESYFESINHHVVIDYQLLVESGEAAAWDCVDLFAETTPFDRDSWPCDILSKLHDDTCETLLEEVFSFPTVALSHPQPHVSTMSESSDSRSNSDSSSDEESEYSGLDEVVESFGVRTHLSQSSSGDECPPQCPPPPPPTSPPPAESLSTPPSAWSPLSPHQMEPKVTDQKLKLQENLEGIRLEILKNISNYVAKMAILEKNFLNRPEFSDKFEILSKDDRSQLLMNIGQIVRCAHILEDGMDQIRNNNSLKEIFRVLYEHFKKFFKHYVTYCTEIKGMQETLVRLKQENKNFASALDRMENEKDNEKFGFHQFLDIPKERMFQMNLILSRASTLISKKSKEEPTISCDPIEVENCAKALEVVDQICEESNKNYALEEMRGFYAKFIFPETMASPLSMTTLHQIVKKGEVTKHAESKGRTGIVETTSLFKWSGTKLWLFLFDHYIIIARKKKTKDLAYEVKDFCPVDKVEIATTKHLDSLQKDSHHQYMMVVILKQNHKNERTELVFSCAEEADRDDWLDEMTSLHITIGVGASHLYGENLIDNCSGKDLLSHWQVVQSGSEGWKVEIDPEAAAPFPSEQSFCFDSSNSECLVKEQTIELSTKGFSPRKMDDEPHIHVGEWYAGRNDFTTKYELRVELLNENKIMMTEYIFKEVIDADKGGKWKHVSHEFRNYGKGVRFIRFSHQGEHGSKMTEATVKIKRTTAGDGKVADRPAVDKISNRRRRSASQSDSSSQSSSDEDDSKPVAASSGSSHDSSDEDDTGLNASKCFACKKPLSKYFPVDGEVYCPACYEEQVAEKCAKCKKAIVSAGLTYADLPWHKECFTCTNCQSELAGQKFTSRDEKPYCMLCFGQLYAKRCATCCKPIAGPGDSRFVTSGDRDWHNDCFKCAHCKSDLVGRGFFFDAHENIACSKCIKKQK